MNAAMWPRSFLNLSDLSACTTLDIVGDDRVVDQRVNIQKYIIEIVMNIDQSACGANVQHETNEQNEYQLFMS